MKKFNRILVKISGEALADKSHRGIDPKAAEAVAKQLGKVVNSGTQVAVVIGGGNFWRGRMSDSLDRVTADQIGMLATVMNALALADALSACGIPNKVFSAVSVNNVVHPLDFRAEREFLQQGGVVIFGGGTGSPFFSTDTAAVLRACEIQADALFCSKAVDGIYDSDPSQNPNAKKYDEVTFDEVIAKNLKALDLTAVAMCREYGLKLVCFGKDEPDGLLRILKGEKLGTLVKG